MDYNGIVEAVNSIEQDIFDQTDCEYFNLIASTNGFCTTIKFCGIQLWSTEDDMREYIDATDDYEPLEGYLRRQISWEIGKLSKINLSANKET